MGRSPDLFHALVTGIVGLGCIGVFVSVMLNLVGSVDPIDVSPVMRQHVTALYGDPNPRVQCVARDTDGDGYTSCTATYRVDGVGEIGTIEAECASNRWNSGCRLPKVRARVYPHGY